jgi:ADP-ribose diphosphatase
MSEKPRILKTTQLAKTRLFHIEQLDLRFSNGNEAHYERLLSSPQGAVLIIPMKDAQTVLMIKEYAAGVDRYELTLPKGRIEANEPLLTAANRELAEEIGKQAQKLTHLTSVSLAPGYISHVTHIVLAEDLIDAELVGGDEPEPLEVIPWPIEDIAPLHLRDDCSEARTFTALYLARDFYRP